MSKFLIIESAAGPGPGIGGPIMKVSVADLSDGVLRFGTVESVPITDQAADKIGELLASISAAPKKKVSVEMDEDEAKRLGLKPVTT